MENITPLMQSPEMARLLRAQNRRHRHLRDGTLCLSRRVAGLRLSLISAACPDRDTLTQLSGATLINPFSAAHTLQQTRAVQLVTPTTLALLPLEADPERRMHQKWRNRLRHARKSPLSVQEIPLPDDPDHWFWRREQEQIKRRRYRNWPAALTRRFAQVNPGHAHLFVAQLEDHPCAAALFLRHGNSATYHIAHATAQGRQHSAHNLLIWRAIRRLYAQGCRSLILGPISTEDAPGLARFKLGTGAIAHKTGGSWLYWGR